MPSEPGKKSLGVSGIIVELVIITVLFTVPVLSIASSLIMPNVNLGTEVIDNVSGYYGPGSVAAWLVLALGTFEFKVLCKLFILRLFNGFEWIQDDILSGWEIDGSIIGTVTYPLITLVDLIVQIAALTKSESTDKFIHEVIDAQMAVMHLSSVVSVVALTAHAILLFFIWITKDDLTAECSYMHNMRIRRARLALWTIMFIISQLCMSFLAAPLESTSVFGFQKWIKRLVVLLTTMSVLLPDGYARGGSSKIAWLTYVFLNILVLPTFKVGEDQKYGIRISWPRTSARLSDLDQAAALAVALWIMGTNLVGWVAQAIWTDKVVSSMPKVEDDTPTVDIPFHDPPVQSSNQDGCSAGPSVVPQELRPVSNSLGSQIGQDTPDLT